MKKKILSVMLALILMFALVPAATVTVSAAEEITAKPTASKVIVNGEDMSFDAYNINDNNYFKLRDLAYVLNGTEKQFEVGYDDSTKAITLTSGKPYTEVGGEMTGKGAGNKTATPTASKVYLDGKEINLTAYTIEGNNYFKLRDIAQALDFYVAWNEVQNAISINTNQRYVLGKEFASAFGSFFGGTNEPDNFGLVQYWDTGTEKIKFETVADEKTEWYVLQINGNTVDIDWLLWFDQIIVMDDIVIITTGGTDVNSTNLYIFDFNGKTLFKTYYLNNKGMVIRGYVSVDGNKIIMPGTRFTHGINLKMKNINAEFSEYSDYLYQDTIYEYKDIEYEYHGSEVYIYNGTTFSEAAAILNKAEIVEATFELEYLGGGKFGKIKMAGNIKTLEQYKEEIEAKARLNRIAESRAFAEAFGYYFGTIDDPELQGVIQYWDTGKEKIKFETAPNEETERYMLKINDNKVDIPFAWFDQIFVMDDIIIITTGGTDVRSTPIYIVDFNGKTLFKTYYLNNKGMVIDRPISIDGNKIIMPGTRLTHGISLIMESGVSAFYLQSISDSDYLYQDTVYDYKDLIYNDVNNTEVYLGSPDSMSEEAKLLNKAEIVEADFELEYLGGGKFGKIKMTDNITTLEQYFLAISPALVNDPADKMEDSALIDMFETTLYNNAITLISMYVGGFGLDLDWDSFDNSNERGKYIEVGNIKNIASLKANYEAVFSRGLLDKYIYPVLFERELPLFVEYDGKLHYNADTGGGMSAAPDFTRASVTNKSADTFEIEMPMANDAIFTYKVVQQNGNWVLDSFYVFDLQN